MIKSMTGFGSASFEDENLRIQIEIRTLNSKQLDLNIRFPKLLNEKENEIRTIIANKLTRGKVSASIEFHLLENKEGKVKVNEELVSSYYQALKAVATNVGSDSNDSLFLKALEMPRAIEYVKEDGLDKAHWDKALEVLNTALDQCDSFRKDEGAALEVKLSEYIQAITNYSKEVEKIDPIRVDHIKQRVKEKMETLVGSDNFDQNRFEQEMIFYIEKLDITEEKVRLKNHLDYFSSVMETSDTSGKKLGFIAQELGREINTTGSKANNADMQKIVVCMKEELEKIKEQTLNVL